MEYVLHCSDVHVHHHVNHINHYALLCAQQNTFERLPGESVLLCSLSFQMNGLLSNATAQLCVAVTCVGALL